MKALRTRLALAGALVAAAVAVPSLTFAGISGTAATGVQVQNTTQSSATIEVNLYPQGGGSAVPLAGTTLGSEAATNYYLPSLSSVGPGTYSMVVSSDQVVQAIARTDWSATGGAAIYGSVAPGTDVIVPLVTRGFVGQTSQITVQSAGSAGSTYTLELYGRGSGTPSKTLPGETAAGFQSRTYDLGGSVGDGLPNTGTDIGVPTGFAGYARVRVTSGDPVVVQSFIDIAGSPAVGGFSGVPAASAKTTLYAPLVRASYFGDTGIALVNPNGSNASVTIDFIPDALSPSQVVAQQTLTVNANSVQFPFQGPGGDSRQGPKPLPANGNWFGVARITSSVGILAVVNDTVFNPNFTVKFQSTYNALTDSDAGTRFALPLVRRRHVCNLAVTTGIQVQNTSTTQSATVTLELTNWDGTKPSGIGGPLTVTVPPGGSGNLYQGALTGLPTVPPQQGSCGWYGSAIITSTQPIVVMVNDAGEGAVVLDSANYTGLRIQ